MPYGADPTGPPSSGYGKDPTSPPLTSPAPAQPQVQSSEQAAAPFPSSGPGPFTPRAATLEELSVPGRDAIRDPFGNMTTDPTGLVGTVQSIAYLPAAIEQHRDLVKKMEQAGYSEGQIAEERKNNPAFNALFSVVAGPLAGRALGRAGEMLPGEFPSGETLFPGSSAPAVPKAQRIVQGAFEQSVKGGQTTALDAVNQLTAARLSGQPLTISDIGGKGVERLAGTVYRRGGEAGAAMEKFYRERGKELTPDLMNTAAGARLEKAINESIGTGSFKAAAKRVIDERAERARPLWDEAMAGGSTAPLESHFTKLFNLASKQESDSVRELAQARNALTAAQGKKATAGNVYSSSAAARDSRAAQQQVNAATVNLEKVRKAGDDIRARLRRAQDDGTANAPGAIWSPVIQQFLDLPEWKEGINKGYRQERRDAITEKRPFNPSEYAIVGTDEHGDPVVGAVPTTKLLQVAREGMAAKVDDHRNEFGGLTQEGRSLWRNLKAFEHEAFDLNPKWKEANDTWARDTDSRRALDLGKKIFTIPFEDLVDDFNGMSDGDKELFKLAAASKAVEDVGKTPLDADPSKRVINNPDELRRLRVLFNTPGRASILDEYDFHQFVSAVNRERIMFETSRAVMGGSQTIERATADALTPSLHLLHGLGHIASLHLPSGVASLARAARGFGVLGPGARTNLEIAKLLTNPNLAVGISPELKGRGIMLGHPENIQFGVEDLLSQAQGP